MILQTMRDFTTPMISCQTTSKLRRMPKSTKSPRRTRARSLRSHSVALMRMLSSLSSLNTCPTPRTTVKVSIVGHTATAVSMMFVSHGSSESLSDSCFISFVNRSKLLSTRSLFFFQCSFSIICISFLPPSNLMRKSLNALISSASFSSLSSIFSLNCFQKWPIVKYIR